MRMAQPGPTPGTIRFGVYEVDLANAELRKHGLPIPIQQQPFQVLTALIERPGEIVAREDLVRRLWPDGTFVDFDRGLNAAVTRLRQALSDSVENPRYVETVARRGYRFVAPVGALAEPDTRDASKLARSRLRWVGVALVSIFAVAGAIWIAARRAPESASSSKPIPLTAYPGFERTPSFSPDGNQVAFTWDEGNGEPHLYIKQVRGGDALRVVSAPGAVYGPAWSRDGLRIAFVRRLDQSTVAAFVVPALGGVERKVAEFAPPEPGFSYSTSAVSRWLDWTPDSKHLVITGADRPGGRQGLFLLTLDTGERRWITGVPTQKMADFSPAVSPDGRTLAFCRITSLRISGLYIMPLSNSPQPGGEPLQLILGEDSCDSPAWAQNGREILYQSGRNADAVLSRIGAYDRSLPQRLKLAGAGAYDPAISPRGRLAYAHRVIDSNIWRQELSSGPNAIQRPVNLIASTADDRSARYSPDGTQIAFQSWRSGNSEIWVCASDGSHCVQLTAMDGPHTGSPSWSPDGTQIAFDSLAAGNFDIWVVDANGGRLRRVTDNPAGDAAPNWSADGKWIYFMSLRTDASEIWKAPAGGGTAVQVTRNGGYYALESTDGRTLFYTKAGYSGKLWKSGLDGSGETAIVDGVISRSFVVASDRAYYLHVETGGAIGLRGRMLATGEDFPITIIRKPVNLGLSLSPDGRYILYSQVDHAGSDLVLVDNFQ